MLVQQVDAQYIALTLPFPLITRCCQIPASSSPCWAGIWGAATQEAGICLSLRGQGTGPGQIRAWIWEGWVDSLTGIPGHSSRCRP